MCLFSSLLGSVLEFLFSEKKCFFFFFTFYCVREGEGGDGCVKIRADNSRKHDTLRQVEKMFDKY